MNGSIFFPYQGCCCPLCIPSSCDSSKTGEGEDDIFASFFLLGGQFNSGTLIPLFSDITDTTGNIVAADATHISLAPGYYLVAYNVSAIFRTANYMQITPSYNGVPRNDNGVYFATSVNGSSVGGSAHFIIRAPNPTVFTLTYSGSGEAIEGAANLTMLKLKRPL